MRANDIQHGGSHYMRGGSLQHWDWVAFNRLGYFEGCATKYVARHRFKNKLEDLNKAEHFIRKLLELYSEGKISVEDNPLQRVSAESFAAMNGLNELEEEFCRLVMEWDSEEDLLTAIAIVDQLKLMLS